ncbi:MAG: VWA domain-containing protein [Proteobacteria bacterium]|nr:VWA domain-containing protein [Pseudomonadota bacterium]
MAIPHFWEPEETVGTAWHDLVRDWGAEPDHAGARVSYTDVAVSVGLMHRAAGGNPGTEILPSAATVAKSRVTGRRRLGHDVDHVTRASYDGQMLALPGAIALFDDPARNRALYLWLSALAAFFEMPFEPPGAALADDLAMLRAAHRAEARLMATLPGFRTMRGDLAGALLAQRPQPKLPPVEMELEAAIRLLLQGAEPGDNTLHGVIIGDGDLAAFATPPEYKPFRPVALWPLLAPWRAGDRSRGDDAGETSATPPGEGSEKTLRAQRHEADQANRKDSFILHRFESIMSWVEFLNINRAIEDEDEDNAKKAAEDLDEVSLARNTRSAKTKLKFHLDLSPRDVERERLIGETTYPEWDWKAGSYLAHHVCVQERLAEEKDDDALDRPRTRRRIARVRRQFEALRPRRRIVRRQTDGFDLDFDEVVRARCDLMASGEASDRLYAAIRDDERDLAVSVLIDISRSTESSVAGRPVIEIAREALAALIGGIDACGDSVSVHAFSSLRRDRVMVERVKDFTEPNTDTIRRRIMGLTPRHYTRMGAAIRHVSHHLATHTAQRRLLLVITDGKPNDLDHYEGRHGIEDTRRAVREARRLGQAVFAVTVDARARDYIPYLFGQNGFAIIPDAETLIEALPDMYRHVAG